MGFIDEQKFAELSQEDGHPMMDECLTDNDQLRCAGYSVRGEAHNSVRNTVTLQIKDGEAEATDGPCAENSDMLAGILLFEARGIHHAIELMSKHPGVKMAPFEIWPANEGVNGLIAATAQET